MPKLAVFGDEIAREIATQIEVMQSEGVRALELRAAEGFGVLDLAGAVRDEVRQRLTDGGIEVFSIGSPLGKVDITAPFADELERLRIAIDQAHCFGAPRIRVFSFFMPDGDWAPWRAEVMDRLAQMAAVAAEAGVMLCHENEARIYGERVAQCADIMATVGGPAFRAVHDSANFVCAGEAAYPDGYEAVAPWLEYVHIKDYRDGQCREAGAGDGRMPELFAALQRTGFDGYLSLEPHLEGGPEAFRRAARTLKRLLDELGWAYA